MRQYLTVLFCGSLLGAVCAAAAGGALEKYVRYLAALLCILLIVSPFRELELSFSLPEEPSEGSLPEGESLSRLAGKEAEDEICRILAAQLSAGTGITPAEVGIDMDWTHEEGVISAVRLVLHPEDLPRAEEISAWAEASYGVPCYVTEGEEAT
jgi:hypothetical protein